MKWGVVLVAVCFRLFAFYGTEEARAEKPSVDLSWTAASRDAIRVGVVGEDEFLNRCAVSGLEVRYVYKVRLCRSRSWWVDSCEVTKILVQSLKYDPIAESFHLQSDYLGDGKSAQTSTAATRDEAFTFLKNVKSLPLLWLGATGEQGEAGKRYLLVDVIADCVSEYSETFAKLSSVLSLGMVTSGVFDSGTITFRLDD